MSILEFLQTFFPLVAALSSMLFAQTLKCLIFLILGRPITLKALLQPGGMPSTHAAAVIGLTTAIAILDGLTSHTFMISLIFSFIVLYDASGVRYTVGVHGKVLNDITKKEHDLSELLGHTPSEVFAGSLIGILIPFSLAMILLSA